MDPRVPAGGSQPESGALQEALAEVALRYLAGHGNEDPSEVVVDELAGCLIALAFVPRTIPWFLAAFVLFRVFDILKPGPIGLIDRRARGAWGVMGDDVVAGALAGLVLVALAHL